LDSIWSNVTLDGVAESTAEAVVALAHRPAARVSLSRPDSPARISASVGTWDAGRKWLPRLLGDSTDLRENTLRDKVGLDLGTLSTPQLRTGETTSPDDAEAERLLATQAGLAAGYMRMQERAERFEFEAASARSELHLLRRAWQIALDEAPHGMAMVGLKHDDYGKLLQANDALGRIAEAELRDVIGTPLLDLLARDSRAAVASSLRRAAEGRRKPSVRLAYIATRTGNLRRVRITTTPVPGPDNRMEVAVCHVEQLVDQGTRDADSVTRTDTADLAARVARAIKDAQRYDATTALMLCDLSDLDQLVTGDVRGSKEQIVTDVLKRLRSALREDDSVGQLDDQALSLLLADINSADALTVAERVRAILSEVALEHGHKVRPHVGITMIDSGTSVPASVRNATAAMHAARTSSTKISLYRSTCPPSASNASTYIIRNRRRRGGLRK
jgi:PAS domain S-box-containing protein